MKKVIIASYPGIGREQATGRLRSMAKSIDTASFKYLTTITGDRVNHPEWVIHPEWPDNIVKCIKALAYETEGIYDYRDLMYIFIDINKDILDRLIDDKVPFIMAVPASDSKKRFIELLYGKDVLDSVDKIASEYSDGDGFSLQYIDDLSEETDSLSFYERCLITLYGSAD